MHALGGAAVTSMLPPHSLSALLTRPIAMNTLWDDPATISTFY